MTRSLRSLRVRDVFLLAAPLVGGISAGSVAVRYAIAQDWEVAVWAGLAAVWAFCYAASLRLPALASAPEPVRRGRQAVNFRGGPEDGSEIYIPRDADLLDAELRISGADYRVSEVEHTCYRADFVQLVLDEDGGTR